MVEVEDFDFDQLSVLKMVWIHRVNEMVILAEKCEAEIENNKDLTKYKDYLQVIQNELPQCSQDVKAGFQQMKEQKISAKDYNDIKIVFEKLLKDLYTHLPD